jgi:hypothetical protein
MFKFVSKTLFAIAVAATTITSLPSAASADGIEFRFGFGDGGHRRHHRDEDGPRFFPGMPGLPGDDGFGEGRGFYSHRPRGGCDEWEAVDTARAYGLRGPRIVHYGRKVVVEGRRYHNWVRLVMINAPGCPVINR